MPAFAFLLLLLMLAGSIDADPSASIRFASIAPDGTPWADQVAAMKQRIESESGGSIRFTQYLNGQLGGEIETLRSLQRGRIHAWGGSVGALATIVPALEVLELPYLFRSFDEVDYVLDEVVFDDVYQLLDRKGLILHSWNENGWRNIGSKQLAIVSPADLAGVKMRSQQSPIHISMWRTWGANPVPISVPEVLPSLQTGVVSAFDNSTLFTIATSWHTTIKHFTLSQHMYQPGAIVYGSVFFKELSPGQQKIVTGDRRAEARQGRQGVRTLEPELIALMEKEGVTIHRLSPKQRDSFAEAIQPVYGEFGKSEGHELLAKIQRALNDFRSAQTRSGPSGKASKN